MSIRMIADADLNFAIVSGARLGEPGIDFLAAAEAELQGTDDPEVLRLAASQNRILVSHDMSTMPIHFVREAGRSPGVFLVSQNAAVRDVIDAVVLVCSASSQADWENQIHHLPSLARHEFRRRVDAK